MTENTALKMRILIVAALFPPDAKGGAELSAYYAAQWLAGKGFEVGVLTCARSPNDQAEGAALEGSSIRIWRIWYPRPYSPGNHEAQPGWKKLIWHIQDHFDPRNIRIMRSVLEQFRPSSIHVHLLSGCGHNALKAPADFAIPVIYILHDLVLACIRSSMYRDCRNCRRQCIECTFSSRLKLSYLRQCIPLLLISPSKANLKFLNSILPLEAFMQRTIPNIDLQPAPKARAQNDTGRVNFLFVGRLHETKGVGFLIETFLSIDVLTPPWHLTLVGGGPMEKSLRSQFEHDPRITIVGRVDPGMVSEFLSAADFFCFPSLWRENHPGVVRESLRAGVPVLVSDAGGSSEMISDGVTGIVVKAGDVGQWREAILRLMIDSKFRSALQDNAYATRNNYTVEDLGDQLLSANRDLLSKATFPR